MWPVRAYRLGVAALTALCWTHSGIDSLGQTPPPSSFDVIERSIDDIHAALRSGVACHAIIEQYLSRIEAYNRKGPSLNAVQTVNPRAVDEADRLDALARTGGATGRLHCIPILVKDQLET